MILFTGHIQLHQSPLACNLSGHMVLKSLRSEAWDRSKEVSKLHTTPWLWSSSGSQSGAVF